MYTRLDSDYTCGAECVDGSPCEIKVYREDDLCRTHTDEDDPNVIPTAVFIRAALECDGNVTHMAEAIGCDRRTVQKRRSESDELDEVMSFQDEKINDMAEAGLVEHVKRGEPWAIKFRLNSKAKDRGYGKSMDITSDGEKVGAAIMYPSDERKKDDANDG